MVEFAIQNPFATVVIVFILASMVEGVVKSIFSNKKEDKNIVEFSVVKNNSED